jgi:RimJ/RimL family protein N-acetyltransferase
VTLPVLVDLPHEILTPRLSLRAPRIGDGPQVYEAVGESLSELRSFLSALPWVAGEQSAANSEAWCRNSASNFIARRDMPFLIFERGSGRLLAVTGLHRMEWAVPKADVGYWCRTSAARQGVVSEAVDALVRVAFDTLRMERLEIITDERNVASRRVAERCGFEFEGIHRHAQRSPDGTLRDVCMYARLR